MRKQFLSGILILLLAVSAVYTADLSANDVIESAQSISPSDVQSAMAEPIGDSFQSANSDSVQTIQSANGGPIDEKQAKAPQGMTGDEYDDISARWNYVKTYDTQNNSPLQMRPTLDEIDEGITEYGYSFWFKWDYLWRDNYEFDITRTSQLIEVAFLSQHENSACKAVDEKSKDPLDNTMSLWLDLTDSEPELIAITAEGEQRFGFPNGNYDNVWTFVHFSYSEAAQKTVVGVKTENNNVQIREFAGKHPAITEDEKLYFRLANSKDSHSHPGWQGAFKEINFTYGPAGKGGYRGTSVAIQNYWESLSKWNPIPAPSVGTVKLSNQDIGNEEHNSMRIEGQVTKSVYGVNIPTEYSIGGWVRASLDHVMDGNKKLIYRVGTKNNALSADNQDLGEFTMQAEISASHITFTTYTIQNLQDVETAVTVQVPISQDDYQNDFYVYQAYSRDAGKVITYVQTYDQAGKGTLQEIDSKAEHIRHMRSNDYIVTMGKDKYHQEAFEGELSCFNFRYGPGSFVSQQLDLDAQVKADEKCVDEGSLDKDEIAPEAKQKRLESYTKQGMFLSHGDPTFVTDDQVANFYVVDGIIGDQDTVSLRSALKVNGEERQDFFFRHSGGLVREQRSDDSEAFKKSASWIVHPDKFVTGTVALESADKRGYYMRRVEWVVRLVSEKEGEEFKGDASWTFNPVQSDPDCKVNCGDEIEPELVPVYRLEHPTTKDQVLAVSEEKIGMLKQQGYTDMNQGSSDSNILGYGWNMNWDGNSSPIMEYYNAETGMHIYTTQPNMLKDGYVFNFIICYGYKALYRGTIPVHQFNEHAGHYYVSQNEEIATVQAVPEQFTNEIKTFWLYGKVEDPTDNAPEGPDCLGNLQMCGPFVPEACEANFYRKNQESECKVCDGEIQHYDGQETSRMYTATCKVCEGGWELVDGVRKCKKCPNGQWVLESGETEMSCYPNCDAKTNHYLEFPSLKCEYCPGELAKHSTQGDVEGLNECLKCRQHTVVKDGKQVCYQCEAGWVETLMGDGAYVCIRTCEKATEYVTEDDNCAECEKPGFVYDDETTTKRCAAPVDVGEGPEEYPHDEESPYTYDVPEDQVDDIKEMAFSLWVRFQVNEPTRFDFAEWMKNDARIAGFNTDAGSIAAYLAAHPNDDKETETLKFTGLSEATAVQELKERKFFQYEWIQIHVAQGATKASTFIQTASNKAFQFNTFDSVISSEFKNIQFTLGRLVGDKLGPLGFQGAFQNLELRFAVSGLFKDTLGGVKEYLSSVGTPVTSIPMRATWSGLTPVLEGAEVDLSTVSDEEKTVVISDLLGSQQYAVYGWFKLDQPKEGEEQTNLHTILFNLKDKAADGSNEIGLVSKVGDYALKTTIEGCKLEFDSYNMTPNGNGDVKDKYHAPLEVETFERWFFVYQAYNGETGQRWSYMQSIMEREEVWEHNEEVAHHIRGNEQVFTLGFKHTQASSASAPFQGSVKGVHVKHGNVCGWKNAACVEALFNNSDKPTPAPGGECVIMYSKPNYQGEFIYNCYENDNFNMDIASIYIPEGVEYKIWHSTQFKDLSVVYTRSQENLERINFQLLLQQQVPGMEVIQNEKYMELLGLNVKDNQQVDEAKEDRVQVNEALRNNKVVEQVVEQKDAGIPHLVKKSSHLRANKMNKKF